MLFKRISITVLLLIVVLSTAVFSDGWLGSRSTLPLRHTLDPLYDKLENELPSGLPQILGDWYFVDPENGASTNNGRSKDQAVASIVTAYGLCTTGDGDGIVLMSSGTTGANTTSYFDTTLVWSKHGITTVGLCSGSMYNQRARVSNATFVPGTLIFPHALASLINVTGNNNVFANMSIVNYGDSVVAVGALIVSGARNHFVNVHVSGCGNATPAAATGANDLYLTGSENTFDRCTFGTNSTIRAGTNANIVLDGPVGQCFFNGCHILSYSATLTHGAIKSYDATAISGWIIFRDCTFVNFNVNKGADLTSLFIGTNPNNEGILMHSCSMAGYAAWDSEAGNDVVFIGSSDATASGAGGIATAP